MLTRQITVWREAKNKEPQPNEYGTKDYASWLQFELIRLSTDNNRLRYYIKSDNKNNVAIFATKGEKNG